MNTGKVDLQFSLIRFCTCILSSTTPLNTLLSGIIWSLSATSVMEISSSKGCSFSPSCNDMWKDFSNTSNLLKGIYCWDAKNKNIYMFGLQGLKMFMVYFLFMTLMLWAYKLHLYMQISNRPAKAPRYDPWKYQRQYDSDYWCTHK